MFMREEQINEEIEEIRELLYNIVKDYPTGITSTFLEQQFYKRYIQTGLAKQLPTNWLNLLRHAEEFRVSSVSTYTILYLANANVSEQRHWGADTVESVGHPSLSSNQNNNNVQIADQPSIFTVHNGNSERQRQQEERTTSSAAETTIAPISTFTAEQFEPIALTNMPTTTSVEVHIVSALDPDNIFLRLKIWDTYCEYLYAALSRLPPNSKLEFEPGNVFGAEIDASWERVELIRKSKTDSQFWVVRVVDIGCFHAVRETALRPLTEAVTAFKKIFLAKCKLDGIHSRFKALPLDFCQSEDQEANQTVHSHWPHECQHYISEALHHATLKDKRVELVPSEGWKYCGAENQAIPLCTGRLLIDGTDFSEQLVSMGLAQRK